MSKEDSIALLSKVRPVDPPDRVLGKIQARIAGVQSSRLTTIWVVRAAAAAVLILSLNVWVLKNAQADSNDLGTTDVAGWSTIDVQLENQLYYD